MSSRSRRRTAQRSGRRGRPAASIPRQRTGGQPDRPSTFVSDDDALLVLHRAVEDTEVQAFLAELPLVRMAQEFLDWVGDGVVIPSGDELPDEAQPDPEAVDGEPGQSEAADLEHRLGVGGIGVTAVERWRSRVLSLACSHWGLVVLTRDGLGPGRDAGGWTSDDPVERAWMRALVVASALECTARYVSAQHVEGDYVRHAFATMLASAGEGQPWPLGLMSAIRVDDVLSEHVDRVVLEHVTELRAWGLLAEGEYFRAAPGAEPLLRSVAVGLRAAPVPVPRS